MVHKENYNRIKQKKSSPVDSAWLEVSIYIVRKGEGGLSLENLTFQNVENFHDEEYLNLLQYMVLMVLIPQFYLKN
jgi:hypothetical protein